MLATGETVGLAEWIIDDTCLVQVGLANKVSFLFSTKLFDIISEIFLYCVKLTIIYPQRNFLVTATNENTGVINDPLGQTHTLVNSEHCEICFVLLDFEKWGQTDGRTTCAKQ